MTNERWLETGSTTGEVVVDQNIYSKRVTCLVDYFGGLNGIPDRYDYERLVGGSMQLLYDKRWGLWQMIPASELRLVDNPSMCSGCECWIDMARVDGRLLSSVVDPCEKVKNQLSFFLGESVKMASFTRKELGVSYIPDLLKGSERPRDWFVNFMIDDSDKLWFVDVYPVALKEAARRLDHPGVLQQANNLAKAI